MYGCLSFIHACKPVSQEGFLFISKPELFKKVLAFFKQNRRLYIAGVLRIVLGVTCLVGARECAMPWIIIVFGILLCAGGVLIFSMKLDTLKEILGWWENRKVIFIRLVGILAFIIGLIVVYAAVIGGK